MFICLEKREVLCGVCEVSALTPHYSNHHYICYLQAFREV